MENGFIAFITSNHMGIVQDLSLVLYYLKLGGSAMVWPAATAEIGYRFLMIEYTKRLAMSGSVVTLGLPRLEDFVTSEVMKIANCPAPVKEQRYFAVFNDDCSAVMKSPDSAMDAFENLAGIAYVVETVSVEEAYRLAVDYSCERTRWRGAYFTSDTFPVLPIAIELDTVYDLGYSKFLTEQTGLPRWMANGNTLINNATGLISEGGENRGRNR